MRRAKGLGRIVRGAFAIRGASSDADRSSAPSGRRARLVALSLVAALFALAILAPSALASKEVIGDFGTAAESGSFGGDLNSPRDVAVNASGVGPANPGDAYVADEANNRIERFASNGNFVSAWGRDTIASSINERQRIVIKASAGTYTLSFDGSTTEPIPHFGGAGTIRSALAALPTVGGSANVEVSGAGSAGNPLIVTFKGALAGANQPTLVAGTSELSGTVEISTIVNGAPTVGDDTGTGFETCPVATECKAGTASGGNAAASGNGSLDHPQSVAVDEDTGNVYVSDRGNRRVDEYDGEGHFIRSFGFDVAESGPGNTGTEYEVCQQAEGDVCKIGVGGAGAGQYGTGNISGFGIAVTPPDGNAATGTVYLADSGNRRVDTFNLDGSSPASFGSSADFGTEQPRAIAVDSRGIVYASDSNNNGDVQRYDTANVDGSGVGFLAPIVPPNNEQQKITFTGFAVGNTYTLTCPNGSPTGELTYSASESGLTIVKNGLEEACGAGNFSASGNPPNTTVTFLGAFAGANEPQMTCTKLTGTGSCAVTTLSEGHPGPLLTGEASSVTGGLAVNPAGTTLYVLRDPPAFGAPTVVQQLGPTHEPGLSTAPTAVDDTHGAAAGFNTVQGFGLNSSSGSLYVSATGSAVGLVAGHRVYRLADSSSLPNPTASMSSVEAGGITAIGDRSATFHGTVDPKGGLVGCKFQYSTDEVNWTDAGFAQGTGDTAQGSTTITNVATTSGVFAVGQLISGAGIEPGTTIVAVRPETLTLSIAVGLGSGTNVTLSASPRFPPDCAALSENGGAQSVSQEATGLVPGQKYFVRLQVTRPYFSSFTPVNSNSQSFTTATSPPAITDASARVVDEHSVRVTATIDPSHSPTSYVVQYGTTPSLGSSTAPVSVGEGSSPIEVSSVIGGLSPATRYYFKVLATNLVGSSVGEGLAVNTFPVPPSFGPCPNDQLRTGPSAHLPDCRAYEQATPTDKFGSDAYGTIYSVEASSSGDGISSFMLAGFPGGEGFQNSQVFLSRFVGGEWSTAGLNPPPSYGDNTPVLGWTPDLALSFARARVSGGAAGFSLVMRDSADGSRAVIIPQGAGFAGKNENQAFTLAGAFDGDSKVLIGANGLVPVSSGPAPVSSEGNVYLYDRETGSLTLAGLLPDSACGSPPCVPAGGSSVPAAFETYVQDGHAVSPGGDVYFTDAGTGQLYLRREAAGPGASTVQVSASERTDCADHDPCNGTPEPDPAGTFKPTFMGATPDGSRGFLLSEQELTDSATTAPGTKDLYSFDPAAPTGQRLADLAPGAEAVGVLGFSDDGSYVYFAANADLDGAGPAASGNCASKPGGFLGDILFSGSCSVYLWQADGAGSCATAGGCVALVARVEAGTPAGAGNTSDGYDWAGANTSNNGIVKASRVSADGRTLVFRSRRPLTGYDNTPLGRACNFGNIDKTPLPCPEFYRYDAESGQLSCLTCDPTGAPPTGLPGLKNPDMYHANTNHAVFEAQPFLSRNLSPDGNRFFFQTPDKLVTADVNGEQACPKGPDPASGAGSGDSSSACTDVYEWEAPNTPGGSCTEGTPPYSPANGGCIYLLSTGTGAYPSYLADVSQSGDTAFIFSRNQLVPSDEDTQEDIYAVKVDGGLAYQHAVRPPSCEGEACAGASSQAPEGPGAGTGAFEGPGNPAPPSGKSCPKGKRKVHAKGKVRCVPKHKRAANNNRRASR
jgi:hypothetical protein